MVDIVMATYNGEKYVAEQIESILAQSFSNFRLIVSDDGSTDGTAAIVDDYAERYPDKVYRVNLGRRFGNARDHFFALMGYSKAEYIFFCDQDDVWFSDKMEKMLFRMHELERTQGKEKPLLVFSDQIPTDKRLVPLCDSLMEMQKQYASEIEWKALLFQNVVTGGASLINQELATLGKQCTCFGNAIMHDWWLGVVAAKFGAVSFLEESTGYYRQHEANSVGAKKVSSTDYVVDKIANIKKVIESIEKKKTQAKEFYNSYLNCLSEEDKEFLRSFDKRKSGWRFYMENKRFFHDKIRFLGMIILG